MQVVVTRNEADSTLQERILAGMALMCRNVENEQQFRELRALVQNWQTSNYIFFRGAFRQKHHAAEYQTMMTVPPKVGDTVEARVAMIRELMNRHLLYLHSVRPEEPSSTAAA